MRKFEELEFNGPLAEFLDNCKPHRVEAIYNSEYRYIKEIIYDEEKQEKYGGEREGYERFSKENPGRMTHSGKVSLRTNLDRDGNILGYMTETKLDSNDRWSMMNKQYELALKKTKELLEVKDEASFMYWYENSGDYSSYSMEANGIISSIKALERMVEDYKEDEDFRKFLDKIKN